MPLGEEKMALVSPMLMIQARTQCLGWRCFLRRSLFLVAITIVLGCSSAKKSPDAGSSDGGRDAADTLDLPFTPDLVVIADGGSEASGSKTGDSAGSEAVEPGIARLSPSTPYVNLGTIDMTTGGAATVTVTNQGNIGTGPLSIVATAGLKVTGCTQPLEPGEACTMTITALPTAVGAFSGTVVVSSNPGMPTRFQVSVTGTVTGTGNDAAPSADMTTVGDLDSPLTPSGFFQKRAEAVCSAVAFACLITPSSCTSARMVEYKAVYEDAFSKSRTFIPSNADACLSKVRDTYGKLTQGSVALKAADYQAMETVCANVYRGAGVPKGACLVDVDCLSDLICDKGYCGTYKLVSKGAGCANIGESCPQGSYCSNANGVWTCADKVGAQDNCAASPCLESLRCVGSVCSVRLGTGESCQSDSECTSGFCEPYLGKCASDIRFASGSAACIAMGGA